MLCTHDGGSVCPTASVWSARACDRGDVTGSYRLSRCKTAALLSDLMGLTNSLGAVSDIEARVRKSLEHAVAEAWERVRGDELKHSEGTSWYQSGVLVALWSVATMAATVLKIVASGDGKTLKLLLGDAGTLVSDRASALKLWAMHHRQICWAFCVSSSGSASRAARARRSAPTCSTP